MIHNSGWKQKSCICSTVRKKNLLIISYTLKPDPLLQKYLKVTKNVLSSEISTKINLKSTDNLNSSTMLLQNSIKGNF